ncbi:MAG: exosortase/archaeosortase family protein [Phycisphaeraceae bacterium]
MNDPIEGHDKTQTAARLATAAVLVLLALLAGYRAWFDIAMIGKHDPEQSQILLAIPAFALLLYFRRDALRFVPLRSSLLGLLTAGLGWGLSWYGYTHAVQSFWHLGALLMAVGAAWSVLGDRAMLVALPAIVTLVALVPVPNLLRQDIALPMQRVTAAGAEFVLVAFGFAVKRVGQTLYYDDKPITIEEACNGMRMVFALLLVCYTFVMAYRLTVFARLLLIAASPLLAIACNIVRVVPTVVIYGEYDEATGDMFHDISGWAMIVIAALMLLGLIRLLTWAEVPIYAPSTPPPMRQPVVKRRRATPWLLAPAGCVLLLSGATAHSLSLPGAADAEPYHRAVVRAAEATPIAVEGLETLPLEIPRGSLELLRANTSRAVQYTDPRTGVTAQFLLIHSRDARDLAGHYPPRCYPNVNGYVEIDRATRTWQTEAATLRGTEYIFAESERNGAPRWVVMHLFVLPNGETTGKLRVMQTAASDYLRRHQGAAQVQLLIRESSATQRQRDALFVRVINANAGLLRTILTGPDATQPSP